MALPSLLLERCIPVPEPTYPHCGVYLLLLADEVVYVGQSRMCDVRIAQHRAANGTFDRAIMIPVQAADLDAYEGALIRSLVPALNRRAPAPRPNEQAILLAFGLAPHVPSARREIINARLRVPGPLAEEG